MSQKSENQNVAENWNSEVLKGKKNLSKIGLKKWIEFNWTKIIYI